MKPSEVYQTVQVRKELIKKLQVKALNLKTSLKSNNSRNQRPVALIRTGWPPLR